MHQSTIGKKLGPHDCISVSAGALILPAGEDPIGAWDWETSCETVLRCAASPCKRSVVGSTKQASAGEFRNIKTISATSVDCTIDEGSAHTEEDLHDQTHGDQGGQQGFMYI
jgi:hypothetical protein